MYILNRILEETNLYVNFLLNKWTLGLTRLQKLVHKVEIDRCHIKRLHIRISSETRAEKTLFEISTFEIFFKSRWI